MITIRALLNRIRWDQAYGQGEFAIGYYDRLEDRMIVVSFAEVWFDPDERFAMQVGAADGQVHSVPLHRVCRVYRNGALIWERQRRRV
jgi:uncharacterized protein (UPF0248 family)